jgi:hypothetical protein
VTPVTARTSTNIKESESDLLVVSKLCPRKGHSRAFQGTQGPRGRGEHRLSSQYSMSLAILKILSAFQRTPDHSSSLPRTFASLFCLSDQGVQSFRTTGVRRGRRTSAGLLVLSLPRCATRSRIRASSVSDLEPYFFSRGAPRKRSESKMKFWPEGSIMTWILSLSF